MPQWLHYLVRKLIHEKKLRKPSRPAATQYPRPQGGDGVNTRTSRAGTPTKQNAWKGPKSAHSPHLTYSSYYRGSLYTQNDDDGETESHAQARATLAYEREKRAYKLLVAAEEVLGKSIQSALKVLRPIEQDKQRTKKNKKQPLKVSRPSSSSSMHHDSDQDDKDTSPSPRINGTREGEATDAHTLRLDSSADFYTWWQGRKRSL